MDRVLENHFVADLNDKDFKEFYEKCGKMKLSDKEIAFTLYYNTVGHPSYRKKGESAAEVYKVTGKAAEKKGTQLYSRPRVRKGIEEAKRFLKPKSYDDLWLEEEHIRLYNKALDRKDYSEARRLLELMGKSRDMYSTKVEQSEGNDDRIHNKVNDIEKRLKERMNNMRLVK